MAKTAEWHGTQQESRDLTSAISHNCVCELGLDGVRVTTCAPHEALLHDQRWLDGLLFMRRKRNCLQAEENKG